MSIRTYVTTADPNNSNLAIGDEKILDTLGPEEDAIAVKLQELFRSISREMENVVNVESKLTIEVTGSMNLKVKGGVQYLFFNAGAEASETGTMKVCLSTTLKPQ